MARSVEVKARTHHLSGLSQCENVDAIPWQARFSSLSWSAFPAHRSCAGSDIRPRPDLRSFPQLTLLMCQVTSVLGGAEGGSRRRLATAARLSQAFGGLPLVTAPRSWRLPPFHYAGRFS